MQLYLRLKCSFLTFHLFCHLVLPIKSTHSTNESNLVTLSYYFCFYQLQTQSVQQLFQTPLSLREPKQFLLKQVRNNPRASCYVFFIFRLIQWRWSQYQDKKALEPGSRTPSKSLRSVRLGRPTPHRRTFWFINSIISRPFFNTCC